MYEGRVILIDNYFSHSYSTEQLFTALMYNLYINRLPIKPICCQGLLILFKLLMDSNIFFSQINSDILSVQS